MEMINAFHITTRDKVASIAKNGLVPNYGSNSGSIGDRTRRVFFTTEENIEFWMNQFHINKEDLVILNFKAQNVGNRIHDNNDLCTDQAILVEEINVVTNAGRIPLRNYYEQSKAIFDELHISNLKQKIKEVFQIIENSLESGGFKERDCVQIIDLMAKVVVIDNYQEFIDEIVIVKECVSKLLSSSNVRITEENYNLIMGVIDRVINKQLVSIEEIFDLKMRIANGFDYDPNMMNVNYFDDLKGYDNNFEYLKSDNKKKL